MLSQKSVCAVLLCSFFFFIQGQGRHVCVEILLKSVKKAVRSGKFSRSVKNR